MYCYCPVSQYYSQYDAKTNVSCLESSAVSHQLTDPKRSSKENFTAPETGRYYLNIGSGPSPAGFFDIALDVPFLPDKVLKNGLGHSPSRDYVDLNKGDQVYIANPAGWPYGFSVCFTKH